MTKPTPSAVLPAATTTLRDRAAAIKASERAPARRWLELKSVPSSAAPTPIWTPVRDEPATAAPQPCVRGSLDSVILEIIMCPIDPSETHRAGNDRKEAALRTLFASLPVNETLPLHRRLLNARPDDALAVAFGRLVIERRGRLLAFLGDARRRAAIGR